MNTDYTGDAVVVRRSSDNTTQSIGFIDGELDVDTLNTFCSGTDGFVATWYDQSGNGYNAANATASQQPKIYDSTSGIITENNKPALEWTTGQVIGLQADFGQVYAQPNTFFTVHKRAIDNGYLFDGIDTTNRNGQYSTSIFSTIELTNAYPSSEMDKQNILTALFNTTNSESHINSVFQKSGNVGTTGLAGITIGNRFNVNNINDTLTGTMQELIIYPIDESGNRADIETNVNDFYSIY